MTDPAIEAVVELLLDAQAKNQVWPSQLAPRLIAAMLDNLPREAMAIGYCGKGWDKLDERRRNILRRGTDAAISAARARMTPRSERDVPK